MAEKFDAADFTVFAACELFAVPLSHAGWDGIVTGEHFTRSVVALAIGIPIGLIGASFHWWKDKVPKARDWLAEQADKWWPAAALLAFIYFTGPVLYETTVSRVVGDQPSGPIVWNIETNAKGLGYFLNIMETAGHELRVLGFQAHGKNITGDPIQHLHGYMRSDRTNAEIPIYLLAQEPGATKVAACFPHPWIPTAPDETYGIPAYAEFNVATYEKPSIEISATEGVMNGTIVSDFNTAFVPFTVVLEYDGGRVERKFSQEEIEQQFAIFQKTFEKSLNPLSDPYVLRKPTARPVTLAPLHPIIPLATPTKPSDDNPTTATPPKD
jgi:hypothetical protein